MINPDFIRATSLVDSELLEAAGQAGQRAYRAVGIETGAGIRDASKALDVSNLILRELTGFYDARQVAVKPPAYGRARSDTYGFDLVNQKGTEIVVDASWQYLLIKQPSFLEGLKSRLRRKPRPGHGPAEEPGIILPSILVGTPRSMKLAAMGYGMDRFVANVWQPEDSLWTDAIDPSSTDVYNNGSI